MTVEAIDCMSITQLQAKQLSGKRWVLDGMTYCFADYDASCPGEPPWKTGAEGIAYPILTVHGEAALYAKFSDPAKVTAKRIERMMWLVGQQIHEWTAEIRGAPRAWITTHTVGRVCPEFDFACTLSEAVPGKTWHETKVDISSGKSAWDKSRRERCVHDFLRALSVLERSDLIHGDLSPGNLVLDLTAAQGKPSLYLIDFDAFVCTRAGKLRSLSAKEGGTYGTHGYCPPELTEAILGGTQDVAPYTDRYSRDVLLVELLGFESSFGFEEPASNWDRSKRRTALQKRPLARQLSHLLDDKLFELAHDQRPSSVELCRALGITTPPRVRARRSYPSKTTFAPTYVSVHAYERIARFSVRFLVAACVLQWALLSFLFSTRLFPSSSANHASVAGLLLLLPARLLVSLPLLLAGVVLFARYVLRGNWTQLSGRASSLIQGSATKPWPLFRRVIGFLNSLARIMLLMKNNPP
jgi:hypothetical protein